MGSDKLIVKGAREHNLKNIDLETKEEYPKKDVANIIDYYSTKTRKINSNSLLFYK